MPRATAREGEGSRIERKKKKNPKWECLGPLVSLSISIPSFPQISTRFFFPSQQTCNFSRKSLQGLYCPLSSASTALGHALPSQHGVRSHVPPTLQNSPGIRESGALPHTRLLSRAQPSQKPGLPNYVLSSTGPSPIWSLQIMR